VVNALRFKSISFCPFRWTRRRIITSRYVLANHSLKTSHRSNSLLLRCNLVLRGWLPVVCFQDYTFIRKVPIVKRVCSLVDDPKDCPTLFQVYIMQEDNEWRWLQKKAWWGQDQHKKSVGYWNFSLQVAVISGEWPFTIHTCKYN